MTMTRSWILTALASLSLAAGCANKKQTLSEAPPAGRLQPTPAHPAPPVQRPASETFDEEAWFRTASLEELQARLSDVYFDYDISDLKTDARTTIQSNTQWLLKSYNTVVVEVEGHCDERGTLDYNLALGERRSSSVAEYLMALGLPRHRLRIVSYGKERPQCTIASENCWWKNRRAHFRIASKGAGD